MKNEVEEFDRLKNLNHRINYNLALGIHIFNLYVIRACDRIKWPRVSERARGGVRASNGPGRKQKKKKKIA